MVVVYTNQRVYGCKNTKELEVVGYGVDKSIKVEESN